MVSHLRDLALELGDLSVLVVNVINVVLELCSADHRFSLLSLSSLAGCPLTLLSESCSLLLMLPR